MSDEEIDASNAILTEQLALLKALHEIASDSQDAEIVRIAYSALTTTSSGMAYLAANPVVS